MKPLPLSLVSFITGAIIAGGAVYTLKPKRAAVTGDDILFLNQKMSQSSFPALRTAKKDAIQAMQFYEHRGDESKASALCSRALTNFLAEIDRSLAQGDLYFMTADLERDRQQIMSFVEAHPSLKKAEEEANRVAGGS